MLQAVSLAHVLGAYVRSATCYRHRGGLTGAASGACAWVVLDLYSTRFEAWHALQCWAQTTACKQTQPW